METWRFYSELTEPDNHNGAGRAVRSGRPARPVTVSLHETPVPFVCVALLIMVVTPPEYALLRNCAVLGMCAGYVGCRCYRVWCSGGGGARAVDPLSRPRPTKPPPGWSAAAASAADSPPAYHCAVQVDDYQSAPPGYTEAAGHKGGTVQRPYRLSPIPQETPLEVGEV